MRHVTIDTFINENNDSCDQATKALRNARYENDWQHIQSLQLQGALIKCVTKSLSKTAIKKWSSQLSNVTIPIYKFVRKALQQQLPTASNLVRWGKLTNLLCVLCNKSQTNKHVLSNRASAAALKRYSSRHNHVLMILAEWLSTSMRPTKVLR